MRSQRLSIIVEDHFSAVSIELVLQASMTFIRL